MFKAWIILMIIIPMVGCSTMRDLWREYNVDESVEPTEPTELVVVGVPEATPIDRGPVSQWMRVDYADGQYIQFAMHHHADHWGDPGTGAGTVNGEAVNVNIELRKRSEIGIATPVAIPDQEYNWESWRTENGKTMYMDGGIDLYGLKVAITYASELGVTGDPVGAESINEVY